MRSHVGILTSRVCFGLRDNAICLWVFEWDDRSVECGVFYCCWNDGNVPQSVCMIEVSCEYLLDVFENLECIFADQGKAAVVAELPNL